MTFLEYVERAIKEDREFDAVIGDVEMPATFGFCDDWKITDYCKEVYGVLLNSEVREIDDSTVEVLYDDWKLGEKFSYSVAGYISEVEWNKLFTDGGDDGQNIDIQ